MRILIGLLLLVIAQACTANSNDKVIVIADMSRCQPASALSNSLEQGKWRLLTYESAEVIGTMVKAPSFIDAPDLTIPLDVTGWHAVYIGYWNPTFDYDGSFLIKVKLSDNLGFQRIAEKWSSDSQVRTFLREVFFRCADLTGRDIILGKCAGATGKKASLAYVKLVPLSSEQVAKIKRDRSCDETKRLHVTNDGYSFVSGGEFSAASDLRDAVEPYRYSDVERVLWAVCYGDVTNYPTSVKGATFGPAREVTRTTLCQPPANSYTRFESTWTESMRSLADKGVIAPQVVAEHLHSMDIECDLMYRLGIIGDMFRGPHETFIAQAPECGQVDRHGNAIAKASYAFPRVQKLMLDIICESMQLIDADGASLCFTRGPRFIRYEKPVLDLFHRKYGLDARSVEPSDPRLLQTRAVIMTQFVREVRCALDEIGRKKGKTLRLSVWVWPHDQHTWCGLTPMHDGLDVATWVKEGLVDSVVCKQGIDQEYLSLCAVHNCEYVACNEKELWRNPEDVAKIYDAGVKSFMWWDIHDVQQDPVHWGWLRRVGHKNEMANWDSQVFQPRSIELKEVGGVNVYDENLRQAAYSGG